MRWGHFLQPETSIDMAGSNLIIYRGAKTWDPDGRDGMGEPRCCVQQQPGSSTADCGPYMMGIEADWSVAVRTRSGWGLLGFSHAKVFFLSS